MTIGQVPAVPPGWSSQSSGRPLSTWPGGGTPAASVIIPVYADAAALRTTLPAILRAASHAGGAIEFIAAVTPAGDGSGGIVSSLLSGQRHTILDVPPGKFRALRRAVDEAAAPILVFVDADVIPSVDAFRALLEPIESGEADVTLPRRAVATGRARGRVAHWLERWAVLWAAAWHEVRRREPRCLWHLSGDLYAMRKEYFPREVPVPVIEDACVGRAALNAGARFRYVPSVTVRFGAPQTPGDWLCQKTRTRRGFVRLGRIEPALGPLQEELIGAVRRLPHGRSLAARSLVWQERAVRLVARVLDRPSRPAAETWTAVASTKHALREEDSVRPVLRAGGAPVPLE
jgi:hypothetical protein